MLSFGSIRHVGYSVSLVLLVHSTSVKAPAADPIQPLRELVYELASEGGNITNKVEQIRAVSEGAKLLQRSVPMLIHRLSDESALVRGMAAVALGDLGPAAKEAIPALIAAFPEEDNEVKAYIAGALGRMGPLAAPAVPMLLDELEAGEDPRRSPGYRGNVDGAIIRALGEIEDPAAVPVLVEMLYAEDPASDRKRLHASYALAKIGEPAIPPLIASLPRDSARGQEAAQTLGRIGRIAFPALREVLENGSARAKEGAITALERSRTYAHVPASEIVPILIGALQDQEIQKEAAQALGFLGREAADAVPALIPLLDSPEPEVQQAAAYALGSMGPAAGDAVPHLIPLLDSPDPKTRARAAAGLSIGPAAKEALPGLIELLDDSNPEVRAAAAHSLSHLGTLAAPAMPSLIPLLGNKNRQVSGAARIALSGHGRVIPGIGPAAVEPLREALRSGSVSVRSGAAVALGRLGEMAESSIPGLQDALADVEPRVRESAAWALGEMGAAAEGAVAGLVRLLEDEEHRVRQKAAEALGKIGAPSAGAPLVELVEETMAEPLPKDDTERMARGSLLREALVALEKIGSEGALPVLRRVVESKEAGHLRMAAAKAWAIIDLESAVPALQKLFEAPASLDYFGFLTPQLISVISNEADELIPTLRRLTMEGSGAERIAAAAALSRFDSEAEAALGLLISELHSESTATRRLAVEALGNLGGEAKPAVEALVHLLQSDDGALHWREVEALRKIGDEAAVEPLLDFMRARSAEEGAAAAWAVLAIDPSVEEPWAVLQEAATSADPGLRGIALDAITDLQSPRALPIVREMVNDPHPRLSFQATQILAQLQE